MPRRGATKAGVTFNGKNRFTDYKTGTEFHIEASVERQLSNALSIGIQAYHFEQISGDSGGGALLGPFEGRVSAVGLTASYGFSAAGRPMTLRGRLFKEFGAKNRLAEGSSMMVDLAIPLKMILPSQAANPPKY